MKGDRTTKFSVSSWAAYTNSKAKLVNAGGKGQIFEGRWKDFEPEDVMQMIGVLIHSCVAVRVRNGFVKSGEFIDRVWWSSSMT